MATLGGREIDRRLGEAVASATGDHKAPKLRELGYLLSDRSCSVHTDSSNLVSFGCGFVCPQRGVFTRIGWSGSG